MTPRDYTGFIAGFRQLQPPSGEGYLPSETVLARGIQLVLEGDRKLRGSFKKSFSFVTDLSLRCPELDESVSNAWSGMIIEPISWDQSVPGYRYLIKERGSRALLRDATHHEEVKSLVEAVNRQLLPAIEEHVKFFEERARGREESNYVHALRIRNKLREVQVA